MSERKYVPGKPETSEYELVRSLLRVTRIEDSRFPKIFGVLPSWNMREEITLPVGRMPICLLELLKPNYRLIVHVNIGAEKKEDLYLTDFEFNPGEILEDQERIIKETRRRFG